MAYDVSKLITLGQLKTLATKVQTEDAKLLGTSADASTAITIYGARALADTKLASLSSDDSIVVDTTTNGSATAPNIAVQISSASDNALSLNSSSGTEGLYVGAIGVVKKATANTGYIASYQITVGGTALATEIDIPKDYLVKDATVGTVTTADKASGGKFEDNADFVVGDKYIDFTINTVEGTGTESHIYLNVADLAHVYTAGNGIDISASDEISIKLETGAENGLNTSANGLALATASATTYTYTLVSTAETPAAAGTDYFRKVGDGYVKVTGLTVGTSVVTGLYTRAVTTAGTPGAMTGDQAAAIANLSNLTVANDVEVTDMITEVFGA